MCGTAAGATRSPTCRSKLRRRGWASDASRRSRAADRCARRRAGSSRWGTSGVPRRAETCDESTTATPSRYAGPVFSASDRPDPPPSLACSAAEWRLAPRVTESGTARDVTVVLEGRRLDAGRGVGLERGEGAPLERAGVRGLEHHPGAMPASYASCQRDAQRHQRSPGTSPGKPWAGIGVLRSLPCARENSRNSPVMTTQTLCTPSSSPPLSQQPSR